MVAGFAIMPAILLVFSVNCGAVESLKQKTLDAIGSRATMSNAW